MIFVLSTLAAALAAFCVWLTVRIVNRRERWAKWTAVGLAVLVLTGYPLSFGPACWLTSRYGSLYPSFSATYQPLVSAADRVPTARKILMSYACVGLPENGRILIKHGNALAVYQR